MSMPTACMCCLLIDAALIVLSRDICSQSSATGRETSLAMFHSIGKILWNKRASTTSPRRSLELTLNAGWGQDPEGDRKDKRAKAPPTSKLPKHLKQWNRLPLKTDVDVCYRAMQLRPSSLILPIFRVSSQTLPSRPIPSWDTCITTTRSTAKSPKKQRSLWNTSAKLMP